MLSIAAMTNGQEVYYTTLAREDYYFAGGEPPGQWLGSGATALGLSGTVDKLTLQRLCAGASPDGSRFLVQHQVYTDGRHRQPAWDLTFSAGKPVSALWARVSPPVREIIEGCHNDAVERGFQYIEREAGWTRRGRGGQDIERCTLVAAKFPHGTSRDADPQLHTHLVVPNIGVREDGTTGTIRSHDFYIHKMAAGALYRVELARLLQERLGLRLVRGGISFGLAGVPESLCDDFSKRRHEIERWGTARGVHGAKAYEELALATRHVKQHAAREELFLVWGSIADEHCFPQDKAHKLLHRTEAREPAHDILHQCTLEAVEALTSRQSHFAERDLVRAVSQAVQHLGVSANTVLAVVKEHLDRHQSILRLGTDGHEPHHRFTTTEQFGLEDALYDIIAASEENRSHAVSEANLSGVLRNRPTIRDEQRAALEHITKDTGAMACLVGMAGTGKTYVLDAAREAWERSGFKVVGCALAGRAAQQLQEASGIISRTLEKTFRLLDPSTTDRLVEAARSNFLKGTRKAFDKPREELVLDARTVIVLDEAGMVGTAQTTRLARLADKAGAKLVLVGDPDQLQPIEAGSPFRAAIERLGAGRLTDIIRQYEPWMQDAVRQFAEGDARGALTQYALAEKLKLSPSRTEAMRELITDWRNRRTRDLGQTIILAGLQAEVDDLNKMAQQERDAARELRHLRTAHRAAYDHKEDGESTRHCAVHLHEGDRVLFTRNHAALGVYNGDLGTIQSIRPSLIPGGAEITVRLDRQERMGVFHRHILTTFTLREYNHIDLGYAITTHKAQGGTFERSFVLGGGWMQDRHLSYVQMSRAREETRLYVSEADAGEDLSVLVSEMQRNRTKEMAHDIAERRAQTLTQGQRL